MKEALVLIILIFCACLVTAMAHLIVYVLSGIGHFHLYYYTILPALIILTQIYAKLTEYKTYIKWKKKKK